SVLVAFAARDGTTAIDGSGRNSPFTTALLHHLETPGLEINFLFRNVRDDVIVATQHQQEPFVYGSLSKDPIYLQPVPSPAGAMSPPAAAIAPDERPALTVAPDTARREPKTSPKAKCFSFVGRQFCE